MGILYLYTLKDVGCNSSHMNKTNYSFHKMEETLADKISNLVYEEYSKLKPVCKPVKRSNGVKEWTVLAGIVAVRKQADADTDAEGLETRIISLATGVKALPDRYLARSNGKMVHDCHAEILAIRGLNSVLLEHVAQVESDQDSDLIGRCLYNDTSMYYWRSEWKLALYISRLPCGDSSMANFRENHILKGKEALDIDDDDPYQFIDQNNHSIIRGRLNYKKVGVVRTKPGRYDSEMTLSKSCSDKLCIKQVCSLLNCLTWSLFKEKVFLDYLVIPNLSTRDMLTLRRSFEQRLQGCSHPVHHFKILSCTRPFVDDLQCSTDVDSSPALMSSIKLYFHKDDNTNTIEQAILNGLRNGFYTKGTKTLRKGSETCISRVTQWAKYLELRQLQVDKGSRKGGSYLEFKNSLLDRKQIIESSRTCLAPDGWISTFRDDCLGEVNT